MIVFMLVRKCSLHIPLTLNSQNVFCVPFKNLMHAPDSCTCQDAVGQSTFNCGFMVRAAIAFVTD